jgi:hypothetical protein
VVQRLDNEDGDEPGPGEQRRPSLLGRLPLTGALLLLVLAAVAVAGCGNSEDTNREQARAEVEETVRSVVEAYNDGDMDRFLDKWTDRGLMQEFGATREQLAIVGDALFAGPPLALQAVRNTEVDGNRATADADLVFGVALSPERFRLVRQDGAWRIDGSEPLAPEIPDDVTAIDLKMDDFSFEFDAEKAATGKIAFRAENVGDQDHEMVLLRVPDDFSIEDLLALARAPGPAPQGIEPIAFIDPIGPGERRNAVIVEPLRAGKYMMVCFLPDQENPQAPPHALQGMVAEFQVR